MQYDNNKPRYIRYAIYVALIVLSAILQNSPGGLPEIFGARAFLLLSVCVSIAMFEREIPAAIFGAFSGILWDVSSGKDGFNALVLLILCAICSLLISHIMRNNVLTALVLGSGSIMIYNILYVLVNLVAQGAGLSVKQFFIFYIPSSIYTLVFVPIVYFLVSLIYSSNKTADEQKF